MARFTTNKIAKLAQIYFASYTGTTVLLDVTESWTDTTDGIFRVDTGTNEEWGSFSSITVISSTRIRLNGVEWGLEKDATSDTDTSLANRKTHEKTAPVMIVLHSKDINEFVQRMQDSIFSGDNTFTGKNSYVSTVNVTKILQNVTTTQRNALTGIETGAEILNTTTGNVEHYTGTAWQAEPQGVSYQFASEGASGTFELGSIVDQQNATILGSSGAHTVVQTRYLITTSSGVSDAFKLGVLNALGLFEDNYWYGTAYKFGGTGEDGAIGAGALAINGSDYVVKNYTSFAPGANTVTVNNVNVILHIKVRGNCDLTGTTFNLKGKGGLSGAGGVNNLSTGSTAGSDGNNGTRGNGFIMTNNGRFGGGSTTPLAGAAGTQGRKINTTWIESSKTMFHANGAGGGGGGSGNNDNDTSGGAVVTTGGDGGAGGGTLILEVLGNLTFSGTTIDVRGNDGVAGTNGNAGRNAAGGGGGGGGGTVIIMYVGSLSGSPTITATGGAGGAAGSTTGTPAGNCGSGGGGGASMTNDGAAGAIGTATVAGAGGAGGAGQSVIIKNTSYR